VVASKIIVATIKKEVREETITLATIMIEVREEITKLAIIMIEVREVESTIIAIISQRHQHRSVLQEEMTHQSVQAQARVVRIIMVKVAAWTTLVANATRQAQVEIHLLAANAEAVVENQAKLQAVANAQRHQTTVAVLERRKELTVVEVEEIS
jgi:hypothetical protein